MGEGFVHVVGAQAGIDHKWHAAVSQRVRRLMALAIREPDVQDCGGGRVVLEELFASEHDVANTTVKPASARAHSRFQGDQRFVVNDQDQRLFHERRVAHFR
jgi:hypothetical protein